MKDAPSARSKNRSRSMNLVRALCLAASLVSSAAAYAEMTQQPLEVDDVLEMTVVGTPELNLRATIGADGQVSLPLFGEVPAAGRDIDDLRRQLRKRLPTKVFSSRLAGGQQGINSIDPSDLLLNIVQRSPVYVTGDVSKPGDQPYHPGMTVRQAVALAGGYDVMRLRKTDPFLESADLRSEYAVAWTTFAEQQAKIWRIQAELADKPTMDHDTIPELPLPPKLTRHIMDSEAQQLQISLADFHRSQAHYSSSIAETEQQITALRKQKDLQESEISDAKVELQGLQTLLKKGLAQAPRVTDARRALLMQSTLQLQTNVDILRAATQRTDLVRQRESMQAQRKLTLLNSLKDAQVTLSETKSRLQALGEKLEYTGLIRSQLVRGAGAPPDIVIHRKIESGKFVEVKATEDAIVEPGDVVDVALRLEDSALARMTGE